MKGLALFGFLTLSLIHSIFAFFITAKILNSLCFIELLPWSYCGEITGLINIAATSGLVSIGVLVTFCIWGYKLSKEIQ